MSGSSIRMDRTIISSTFWAWVFGGLYFVILCLITIVLTVLFKPRTIDLWIKKNLGFLFKILFIKVKSERSENVELEKSYPIM